MEIAFHLNVFFKNNREQVPVQTLSKYMLDISKSVAVDLDEEVKEEDIIDTILPFGPTTNQDIAKSILTSNPADLNTIIKADLVDFHGFCLVPPSVFGNRLPYGHSTKMIPDLHQHDPSPRRSSSLSWCFGTNSSILVY
jgi:hypothetical protein